MAKLNIVAGGVDTVVEDAVAVSTSITIDQDIAIPASVRTGGKAKYPWADLTPGASFFIAGAKVETFYTLCSTASKKHGCKFIARKWDGEGGVQGVRVWRTKD